MTATATTLAPSEERLIEEAARWFLRARSDSFTDAQRAELLAWLKAAPDHAAAMDVVSRSWSLSEQAGRSEALAPALLRARSLRDSHADGSRRRVPRWIRGTAIAGAALATVAISAVVLLSKQQTYVTPRGEQLNTILPDGTRVRLDAATRLAVRYGVFSREVRLVSGEAEFDVGHGRWTNRAWRPFRVAVGSMQVWDKGTRFTVRRRGEALRVVLVQGGVELHDPAARTVRARLRPGEAADLTPDGRVTVSPVDLTSALAWQRGELALRATTLASALAEFSARTATSFDIDPAIGAKRISGVYRLNDPVGFLNAVATLYPMRWREVGPGHFEIRTAAPSRR